MTATVRRLDPGQEFDAGEALANDQALLVELEPEAGRLYDRHAKVAQEWFPHDYIPYRLGRDFDKEPWTPDQPRLTGVAQTAFEIGLLTEDNLPSYHRLIHGMFGKGDGAWINWVGRWTAEEGRHAIVLRDYLTVTRNIDPIMLERGRMTQLQQGYDHASPTTLRGLAYVAFQELATRIAHRNTGRYSDDPGGRQDHGPDRRGREPAHGVLPRHPRRRAEDPALGGGPGDRRRGPRVRDAGRRDPGVHPQGGADRQGRDLRPARPPRRGPDADPAPLAHLRARGARRRRRGRPPAPGRASRRARCGGDAGSRRRSPTRASRGSPPRASRARARLRARSASTCQTAPMAVTISQRTPIASSARPMKKPASPRVEASGSSAWRRNRARFREFERNTKSYRSPRNGIRPIARSTTRFTVIRARTMRGMPNRAASAMTHAPTIPATRRRRPG